MLSAEEVLKRASEYDFEAVKAYLEAGGDKEIYDGDGRSLLACLLEGYYIEVYFTDPEEVQSYQGHETDQEYEHTHVHHLTKVPLEDRQHSIKEQIEYLLSEGIGINAVGWEEARKSQGDGPYVETPLYQAVMCQDYCMTEFLLKHGADPGQRLFSDGDWPGYEDFLADEMDILIMNGDHGPAARNNMEIVSLLVQYGLDEWSGYCIEVDRKNRIITAHGPIFKY